MLCQRFNIKSILFANQRRYVVLYYRKRNLTKSIFFCYLTYTITKKKIVGLRVREMERASLSDSAQTCVRAREYMCNSESSTGDRSYAANGENRRSVGKVGAAESRARWELGGLPWPGNRGARTSALFALALGRNVSQKAESTTNTGASVSNARQRKDRLYIVFFFFIF